MTFLLMVCLSRINSIPHWSQSLANPTESITIIHIIIMDEKELHRLQIPV
jgi:hypothetical protein